MSEDVPPGDALDPTPGANESSAAHGSIPQAYKPEQDLEKADFPADNNKRSTSMLHVHAPHETTHSWKAILVQVGVITIGLLIALLLEQLVEYLHHRTQVAEMRVRLKEETARNIDIMQFDVASVAAALQSADAAARTLPSDNDAMRVVWRPGPLSDPHIFVPEDAAWLMMRDSGLLGMVPARLAQDYWKLETTHEYMLELDRDVHRDLIHLRASLSGAAQRPLGTQNAQVLREAFTEYTESLKTFDSALKSLAAQYNRVLAGRSLYFRDLERELNQSHADP